MKAAITVGAITASELTAQPSAASSRTNLLRRALAACVLALAVYQFSESTADPDLWGHIVFGRQMLQTHTLERTEQYSWTAAGQPFVNHEYGADIILGGTHLLFGAAGILLLKVLVGMLTFGICLRPGRSKLTWPASAVAWTLAAVAVVEISFGFAARPQIFTALCLAILLMLLRLIHEGRIKWALALPLLFIFWINVHGGALAGVGLLFLAAGSTMVEYFLLRPGVLRADEEAVTTARQRFGVRQCCAAFLNKDRSSPSATDLPDVTADITIPLALCFGSVAVFTSLLCNPWGVEMLRWLVKSVLWFRPEIEEWNPAPLNLEHLNFFILLGISAFAWAFSRKPRRLWEVAACAAFAVLALRSVRNTPLFAIVALTLVPPHLADGLARFKQHAAGLVELWRKPLVQSAVTLLLLAGTAVSAVCVVCLHKDHPLIMEAPRSKYPVAAVAFMREHQIDGKLLTFFDWGDMTIFELPQSKVSIDGRLDACYSRPLIKAHWNLYNGEAVDTSVLPVDAADLALLPSNLAGTAALKERPGWTLAYYDSTAAVLIRDPARYPQLKSVSLPLHGPGEASLGRAVFPSTLPGRTE